MLSFHATDPSVFCSSCRFDCGQGLTESRRVLHQDLELLGLRRRSEVAKLIVDEARVQGAERDSIPNPLEGGDIAKGCGLIPRRRVQQEPTGPEVEAGHVDLDRRSILQLEVEAGAGDIEGCVGNPAPIVRGDCSDECLERAVHLVIKPRRHLARSKVLPGTRH